MLDTPHTTDVEREEIEDLVDEIEQVDENDAILAHILQQDPYVRFIDGQPA